MEVENSDSEDGFSLMTFSCQDSNTCTCFPLVSGSSESTSTEWLDELVVH